MTGRLTSVTESRANRRERPSFLLDAILLLRRWSLEFKNDIILCDTQAIKVN